MEAINFIPKINETNSEAISIINNLLKDRVVRKRPLKEQLKRLEESNELISKLKVLDDTILPTDDEEISYFMVVKDSESGSTWSEKMSNTLSFDLGSGQNESYYKSEAEKMIEDWNERRKEKRELVRVFKRFTYERNL